MPVRSIKPTKLKILEGEKNKNRIPENEPKPDAIEPDMPLWLDKEAKKIWKKLAPKMLKMELLTEIDGAMFSSLCQIISRVADINKKMKLEKDAIVVEGKQNPLSVSERLYYQHLRMFAQEFGLSPRGRVGLSVGTTKDVSEMENLLD